MFELDKQKGTLTLKPDYSVAPRVYNDVFLSFFYQQFQD